ncbi:Transmembrane domain-containing protein [Spironucleus salmonicida]|uniref:Transmembrane domain-containing protein n=1 Tax=Spironucleus salmonicida TaxID=348837 RepID=V6LMX7_9EUKA|nr:Transmembrane domain-containing protein [Spironucleus salmonicida]|eukprot:EST46042.1 Transmembrane domain-containing protein [Spironucleus salmonicida]
MQRIYPYADQLHLFEFQHYQTLANSISYGYAISLFYSLLSNSTTVGCAQGKVVNPLTWFIYILTAISVVARSIIVRTVFKSFNPVFLLSTIVISVVPVLPLMVILCFFQVHLIDIFLTIYYLVILVIHNIIIWILFSRVIKL